MPLQLTATTRALSRQTNIEQQLILEIEGLPVIFTAIQSTTFVNYGDPNIFYGTPNLVYGGLIDDPNAYPWINLGGSSASIKQQIKSDRGGTSSVQKVSLNIVDVAGQVTNYLTPNNFLKDPLSARATIYVAFKGGSHPRDSVPILSGLIDDVEFDAGSVTLQISHGDDLKRAKVFELFEDELAADITDTDTIIPLVNTKGLFEDQDAIKTYVRINDEVIKVGEVVGNVLTSCVRGQFGTIAVSHETEDTVSSIYSMEGNPIDLALKLMLSGGEEFYLQDYEITSFERLTGSLVIPNSIYFSGVDVAQQFGVTRGDTITITGANNPENNLTDALITQVVRNDLGSYLVVQEDLAEENPTNAIISIKSRYNVLADGCKLSPREVDIAEHELILDQFNSSLFEYLFWIKDTIDCKEFIDTQLYFPSGLFLTFRKGRVSCAITVPPLAQRESKVLDQNGVVSADKIKIRRSTNVNFYNAVIYRFEEDILEDEFTRGVVTQSANSTNRIKTRNKPLVIEAKGLRNNPDTLNKITRQTRRFLDRFQFGAESTRVEVPYKIGFDVEISDAVIFGSPELQISDITQGSREFQPRVMEIVNKSLSIQNGKIVLELLDTAFGIDGRYGSISPSSLVGSGSTTTEIVIKKSFGTEELEIEQEKWTDYVQEIIQVRSPDFTFQENVVFLGFIEGSPNVLKVSALSQAPAEDWIVEAPNYDNGGEQIQRTWKSLHPSLNPQRLVDTGIDNFTFTVTDVSPFSINQSIRVHNLDYSIDSTPTLDLNDAQVIDITGNQLTVDRDLGFTPSSGQFVDLIGYLDSGQPYRYV
jgi:hypothetical protein